MMTEKRKIGLSDECINASQPKKKGFWSLGLKHSMTDPELKIEEDEMIVIIKDKYPKAKHHYLVLPKDEISSMRSLNEKHLAVLKRMDKKGREIANRLAPEVTFRFGYHAVASMSQLHMHVISQDFVSPWLKTKKHWNSFTSAFFVDSEEIMKELEANGKIHVISSSEAKSLMDSPLRCHKCKLQFPTMPKLKEHILKHTNRPK